MECRSIYKADKPKDVLLEVRISVFFIRYSRKTACDSKTLQHYHIPTKRILIGSHRVCLLRERRIYHASYFTCSSAPRFNNTLFLKSK